MPLDILKFVRKWEASTLTERSAYQQQFRDLCEALDVPHPTEVDEVGNSYTFEKHVPKTGTDDKGFADVWKRGYFAWEYKSKGGNLKKAYKQLNEYHEALDNPPLLVVCDFDRFEVHTKFENTPTRVYAFTLNDLLSDKDTPTCAIPPIEVLRHVFVDFNQLRPGVTSARVTEAAAADFLRLAKELELERAANTAPYTKEQIAHFLMRLVFCLFADSIGLLPNNAFRKLIANDRFSPRSFNRKLPVLLEAMSREGGFFGADNIPYFNGDLFRPNDHFLELNHADLGILFSASQHDWSHIEPAIFGTLFERSLDAAKRSLIGAHYTSPDDILLLVEPVIMQPLERRWKEVRQSILAEEHDPGGSPPPAHPSAQTATQTSANGATLYQPGASPQETRMQDEQGLKARSIDARAPHESARRTKRSSAQPTLRLNRPALDLLQSWAAELSSVRILDPACGSGNFLYVALKRLLDLWHEARVFGIHHGLTLSVDPMPTPAQLFGIELDFYAHEIASIVVWIGFLQWKHDHGVKDEKEPLLRKLTNILHDNAIMRYDNEDKPYEPSWPTADFIVSNPPFVGGTQMRKQLGDKYCDDLRDLYDSRVKGAADLVVYWFEKARELTAKNRDLRVGLLSTQGIRGGANQFTLRRILETGEIFWAISDRNWSLDGATVHVSMTAFTAGKVEDLLLDGKSVSKISADLTSGVDTTVAVPLVENSNICFEGTKKHGAFDISQQIAQKMLGAPINPNDRPNSDVVTPWINALDITRRPRNMYIIDFGTSLSAEDAALYEYPFQYIRQHVFPKRQINRRAARKTRWWLHGETNPGMRSRLRTLPRFVATPRVSKYRLFVWLKEGTLPDSATCVFARSDDYFMGILHSRAHETWARKMGTQLREVESGFRYTPKTTFDTFPFPWPSGKEPKDSPAVEAISSAARALVARRDAWLNPADISEADLKKRTLTNLYNDLPTWLADLHRRLDEAVFAAYDWPSDLTDAQILERLLALNHERAAATESD